MKLSAIVTRPPTVVPRGRERAPVPEVPTTVHALACAAAGTAIITASLDREGRMEVTAIERLPAGLEPAAAWLREVVPSPVPSTTKVIIDGDGLGQALHDHLRERRYKLYPKKGRDRQELVNSLLVAEQDHRVGIRTSPHGPALKKALTDYNRVVGDNGEIGKELVIALALATTAKAWTEARIW